MCALSIEAAISKSSETEAINAHRNLPTRAQVVVVGGGIVGCSVAYNLTKLGLNDVVVLERKSLGSGTTWHSHGVVGLSRANGALLRMAMETVAIIPEVEEVSGKSTGYTTRGSINVTEDPSRLIQFKRFADTANAHGLEAHVIGASEAHALYPLMDPAGIIGALYLPSEGQCNPLDFTHALAAAARVGGAKVLEGVCVTGAEMSEGRILAVHTQHGTIACETLVNCTGLWGRDFLRAETGGLPLQGAEHNYLVADFHEAVGPDLPLMRDPDRVMTLREDNGQLSVGFNEVDTKLFATDGVPDDFFFEELPPDWDAILPYLEDAARRVPILNDVGVRMLLCGPEAATPDTRYLLGPSPQIANYFVAAGFCGIGVGSAGGAGRAIAEWIVAGRPQFEPWGVDLRRMAPAQSNRNYLIARTPESNGKLFPIAWPHRQNTTARNLRRSPLHAEMKAARACFIEDAGWEVPEWFAPECVEPIPTYSFERPAWFPHARVETQNAIKTCALADRSMVGKFLLIGPDAKEAHAGVFGADMPHSVAADVFLLNADGGVEAALTALPVGPDQVLLIGDIGPQRRDLAALTQAFSGWSGSSLVDMTSAFAMVELIGPEAETRLRAAGWRAPEGTVFDPRAEIGFATCRLAQTKRFGLPAWCLVVPSESAGALYDALVHIAPIGCHARHALLTAAGTPVWGQALSPSIDLQLGEPLNHGAPKVLCRITLDAPEPVLLGQEIVRINGQHAGTVTQAAYALTGDTAIGLGLIALDPGSASCACEVQIAGDWYPAQVTQVASGNFFATGTGSTPVHS